jgi:hypothetical protein
VAYNKNLNIGPNNVVNISGSIITLTGSLFGSEFSGTTAQFTSFTASNYKLENDLYISGGLTVGKYVQLLPVSGNIIPTNQTASYIYTSGSTNDLYFTQYQPGTNFTNTTRLRWLESILSTGLLHGGVLSTVNGTTTFSLTSGSGLIVTYNASTSSDPYPTIQLVNWPAYVSQSLNYITASQISYISVAEDGEIIQSDKAPTFAEYKDRIFIGRVLHQSGSVTNGATNTPPTAYGLATSTADFIRAIGPLKINGHFLAASGSSLSLTKSAGDSYVEGRNYASNPNIPNIIIAQEDPAVTVSKIYRQHVSGGNPVIDTGIANAGYVDVDPTKYQNANGNLINVGNFNFSVQRVFWFPKAVNRALFVYYGQALYSNLDDAIAGISTENFTEGENTKGSAILVGFLVMKGNASNFDTPSTARIYQASTFRGGGAGGGGGSSGGGTTLPAGSSSYVQFNDVGSFGADSRFTFDKISHTLTVTGTGSFSQLSTGPLTASAAYISGNVGIGTTTPNSTLDVNGNTIISGNLTVTGSTTLSTVSGTTAQFSTITSSNAFINDLITVGYNIAAESAVSKDFSVSHASSNVPSAMWYRMIDGSTSGMRIINTRDGSHNSQNIELWTHHGGVNSGPRVTIDKDGGITAKNGTNSERAFQVKNTSDNTIFYVDTANSRISGTAGQFTSLNVGSNSTDSTLKMGSLEIQPYSVNNAWIGENTYFNGANFIRRADGSAGMFYFAGNEGQFRFAESSNAGTILDNYGNVQFKVNSSGTVALGGTISYINNNYSGATLVVNPTGSIINGNLTVTDSTTFSTISGTNASFSALTSSVAFLATDGFPGIGTGSAGERANIIASSSLYTTKAITAGGTGNGTAAHPTYNFSVQPGTGMYYPTNNTLAFSISTSEAVRIERSTYSKLGINETNPSGLVHATFTTGSPDTTRIILENNNAGNTNASYDLFSVQGLKTRFINVPYNANGFGEWTGGGVLHSSGSTLLSNQSNLHYSAVTHRWYKNAGSGSADRIMTLDSSGNLSVSATLNVAGNTTLTTITSSNGLIQGDLRILGTASIAQLNTIGQTSLLVGDKYITILSGGVDHAGLNGAGFLWGTSSGPGETTGSLGEHAHVLYDSSRDALQIFPGLYVFGNASVSGNLVVTGSIVELSTRNIKTNIQTVNNQLTTISKLNPVSYTRIDDGRKEYGFISEEVKEVYPEFVVGEGINYPKMVSVLVSAVKELTDKVEKQQNEIELLKNKKKTTKGKK